MTVDLPEFFRQSRGDSEWMPGQAGNNFFCLNRFIEVRSPYSRYVPLGNCQNLPWGFILSSKPLRWGFVYFGECGK